MKVSSDDARASLENASVMKKRTAALFSDLSDSEKRRVQNGKATNDLVFSASTDGNDRVFPRVLTMYQAHPLWGLLSEWILD